MSLTRRDLRNEADYLPDTLEDLEALHDRLIDAGHSRRVADGLCMWLFHKARAVPDTTAADVRSRYRRILAELDQPEPAGRRRARGRAARERGDTELRTIAAISAGGATMAVLTPLIGAPGAAVAALYVTGTDGGPELELAAA